MNSNTVTLTRAEYEALKSREAKLQSELEQQREELTDSKDEADRLRYECDQLKRMLFGRKSERHEAREDGLFQSSLFDSPEATQDHAAQQERQEQREQRRGRRKRRYPPNARRRQEHVTIDESERSCSCCGYDLVDIGTDVSEKLHFVPATAEFVEIHRHKYACNNCKGAGVRSAPLPATLFEKSSVTEETRAHIIVSKFCDHLPFYRQSKILERQGFHVSDATMSRVAIEVADHLAMLIPTMWAELLETEYIQADETRLPVLRTERSSTPGARKDWLWAFGNPTGSVVFHYSKTRHGEHATNALEGFEGVLQTDRFQGYNELQEKPKIIDVACWAHCRRYFEKAKNEASRRTDFVLELIRKLYGVEKKARVAKLPARDRAALRERDSKPILGEIKKAIEDLEASPRLASFALQKATQYALNHWDALTRYVSLGHVEIDNNLAENSMRPIALGRKNYLFAGSEIGAEAAAVLYSLTESCRRFEIHPVEYLVHVFRELATRNRRDPEAWRDLTPARYRERFGAIELDRSDDPR